MSDATQIAAEAARAAASPQSRFTPYVMDREFDLFLGNDTQFRLRSESSVFLLRPTRLCLGHQHRARNLLDLCVHNAA
jgi:hypothetical protein